MKLLCLYQVMFHYRVGTYEAISKLPNVDFELWHGADFDGTKKINYKGYVSFRHKQLPRIKLPFKTNNGIGEIPYYPFLLFRLTKYSPDVILTEGTSSLIVSSIAFIYAKLFRKKIIWWTLGELDGRRHSGLRKIIDGWVCYLEKNCDAVFAYSSQAFRYLTSIGVEERRVFVGVNVTDPSRRLSEIERVKKADKESGFNVVFVGAINKSKQLELLIDAVAELSQDYHDVTLHIIGDGNYLENVKKYALSSGGNANVVFHGRVVEGLGQMLTRYQVMVLPGLGGLAIVDGMICSLPVISGPADGTELDLINDDCGFVTKNMTKDFILDKLRILHNDSSLAQRMGENAFQRITGKYSFNSYMNILSDCINFVWYEK